LFSLNLMLCSTHPSHLLLLLGSDLSFLTLTVCNCWYPTFHFTYGPCTPEAYALPTDVSEVCYKYTIHNDNISLLSLRGTGMRSLTRIEIHMRPSFTLSLLRSILLHCQMSSSARTLKSLHEPCFSLIFREIRQAS